MSSNSVGGAAGSKKPLVIALAAVGAVLLILGILWFAGAAPSFLNLGSHVKHGSHLFRGGAAAVVGIGALVGAFFMNKKS